MKFDAVKFLQRLIPEKKAEPVAAEWVIPPLTTEEVIGQILKSQRADSLDIRALMEDGRRIAEAQTDESVGFDEAFDFINTYLAKAGNGKQATVFDGTQLFIFSRVGDNPRIWVERDLRQNCSNRIFMNVKTEGGKWVAADVSIQRGSCDNQRNLISYYSANADEKDIGDTFESVRQLVGKIKTLNGTG